MYIINTKNTDDNKKPSAVVLKAVFIHKELISAKKKRKNKHQSHAKSFNHD